MKHLLLVLLLLASVEAGAQTFSGRVADVVMGTTQVSPEKFERTFTFRAERVDAPAATAAEAPLTHYVLAGALDFDGGPAHHVISFDDRRVGFAVDADGNIVQPQGSGHIKVSVFKFISALDKDFQVKQLTGTLRDGRLKFRLKLVIPDYKDGYTASFTFDGVATKP